MRCPKGFKQQPPKSGNCVKKTTSKSKSSVSRRCPKGTRKNKKTGNCENTNKKLKSPSVKKEASPKKMWKIYKIDYIYPTMVDGLDDIDFGNINIESIFIENEDTVAQIAFEYNQLAEIASIKKENMKKNIAAWESVSNLKNLGVEVDSLEANISNMNFFGTGNDDDGNNTSKENIREIKNGAHGKYVKINVKDLELDSDYIDEHTKKQISEKAVELIRNL
uniref:Uncharacterized protein n=1 Tax=viral metagenome TaxID=1070528 RepID=A0A6C0KJM9_9ZZZZ